MNTTPTKWVIKERFSCTRPLQHLHRGHTIWKRFGYDDDMTPALKRTPISSTEQIWSNDLLRLGEYYRNRKLTSYPFPASNSITNSPTNSWRNTSTARSSDSIAPHKPLPSSNTWKSPQLCGKTWGARARQNTLLLFVETPDMYTK